LAQSRRIGARLGGASSSGYLSQYKKKMLKRLEEISHVASITILREPAKNGRAITPVLLTLSPQKYDCCDTTCLGVRFFNLSIIIYCWMPEAYTLTGLEEQQHVWLL
jgi:hypothetical protein